MTRIFPSFRALAGRAIDLARVLSTASAALLLLSLLLFGCERQQAVPHGEQNRRLTIAVIPMATTDEHWKAVHAGALQAAQELGVDVIWQGPLKYNDRSAQADIVENMRIRPVDGMVLAPIDDMALRGVVEDAYRNNIPVAIVDSKLDSERQISFIATDNFKGGYLAGNISRTCSKAKVLSQCCVAMPAIPRPLTGKRAFLLR